MSDNNQDKSFSLTYSHCTKATPGELDRYPFSEYEHRTVRAIMYRVRWDDLLDNEPDDFRVEVDGKFAGEGDTKEDAVHDARYRLMDRSRQEAYKTAMSKQALESVQQGITQ